MSTETSLQRDEDFARQLQQEELRRLLPSYHFNQNIQNTSINNNSSHNSSNNRSANNSNDFGAPLLNQHDGNGARANQEQVRRNFVQSIQQSQDESPRVLLFRVVIMLIEVIATAAILALSWGEYCDHPLRWWLLAFSARNIIDGPLRIYIYRSRLTGTDVDKPVQILRWLRIFTFIWFLIGQSFLFTNTTCKGTAPILWIYCLVLIICVYVTLALPFLMLLGICICFPCVLLLFRYLAENEGANNDEIEKLPTRIFTTSQDIESLEPNEIDENAPSCAICMAEYENGDELKILPCNHEFHTPCIDRWLPLKKMCPLCRHDVTHEAPSHALNINNNNNNDTNNTNPSNTQPLLQDNVANPTDPNVLQEA